MVTIKQKESDTRGIYVFNRVDFISPQCWAMLYNLISVCANNHATVNDISKTSIHLLLLT